MTAVRIGPKRWDVKPPARRGEAAHPGWLRRRQFFFGRKIHGSEVKDLAWFRVDRATDLDTARAEPGVTEERWRGGQTYDLQGRAMAVLRVTR
jgi:hypothetical protein